ncbi:MAG: ATP-binding cassette domain-containing protein [Candidatus Hydrogenedentes bacterium]|nr:ATP-binding cassette domain-containing protein [Candidatus Hydrogenedentota bacterium]
MAEVAGRHQFAKLNCALSLLRLSNITKSFGGAPALRGVDFEARAGEIHALVGENGAGKSTLINIATGVLRADSGSIEINDVALHLNNPRHASSLGIAVVHQEADLFPQLSVSENMLLSEGSVRGPGGLINWQATHRAADRMLEALGERFDVRAPASELSVARRMMAEIAAALSRNARVLFLDEPTASLTRKEIDALFLRLRELRDAGVAIVFVSHRLDEVLTLCDRVTILRDGATVTTNSAAELSIETIVAAMIGRERQALAPRENRNLATATAPRLEAREVSDGDGAFNNVSLSVRPGEVLGIYGFVGAGRSELAQALFGMRQLSAGTILLDGKQVTVSSPRQAVKAGIAYLPEDRLVQGVFRTHPLRANASVVTLPSISSFTWIHRRAENALGEKVVRDLRVRARSIEQPIGALSGGNQQKVVFGRWQATNPKVLLLDEPTRGVDVGAKAEIHALINDMASRGAAVIMISSELPEIMAMSDRVITISAGRITGEFDPRNDSEQAIATAAVPKSGATDSIMPPRVGFGARLSAYREMGLLAITLALCGIMTLLRPQQFANVDNLLDVLASAALPGIMAQGAMLIICAGGIDISVGAVMGLAAAVSGLAALSGVPPLLCVMIACAIGCACSIANAATALIARIHPIIVTLAGISIYRGIMLYVLSGREVVNLPASYRMLADGSLFGVPKVCYYVVAATLVTYVVLRYTIVGRRALALGNSESAARLIGISKTRVMLFVFAYSGLLTGVAAVMHGAYYGNVQSGAGEGLELKAIAAAVIGGTNILGGRGSAIGTLLGAFLVALLYNALTLLGISSYWQSLFVGALILGAVVIDTALQRARKSA